MKIFIFFLFLTSVFPSNPSLPQHTLPVYGNASLGYYFVKIYVGHPPQQQSVIIDTGSGQLALPCNKCTSCNPKHIHRPFDMRKSKTAEYVTCESNEPQCRKCASKVPTESCQFMISYAEGSSLQGIIIRDFIQFEQSSEGQEIETSFGCTTKQTNLFLKQQANGIFGLSPERTSSLLEDLYRKHHGYSGEDLQFSLCLANNGGQMTIGKVNQSLHRNNNSVRTTFSSHRNLYSLNGVGNVKVGNEFVHKKNDKSGVYGIFIDSGSTFTYFPRENYLRFKNQLIRNCASNKELCEIASGESVLCFHLKGQADIVDTTQMVFPPLVIQINESELEWKASKYFLLRDKSNRQVCLAVESLDRFLLGANWMVDRDIVFNLKQKKLEIFSEANCLKKEIEVRQMSQFTQEIDGHKPLSYDSNFQTMIKSVGRSQVFIIIGIVLVLAGVVGVFIFVLKEREKSQKKLQAIEPPVSTIQSEDHIEMINSGESNTYGHSSQ